MSRHSAIPAVAMTVVAMGLAACGASAGSTTAGSAPPRTIAGTTAVVSSAPHVAGAPCGTAAAEVLARTAGLVATRIYAGELAGSETRSDQRQVEAFMP